MKKLLLTSIICGLMFICSNKVLAQTNHNSTIHEPLGYNPHFDLNLLDRVVTQKQNVLNQRVEYIQNTINNISENITLVYINNNNRDLAIKINGNISDVVNRLNNNTINLENDTSFYHLKDYLDKVNNLLQSKLQ